MQRLQMESRRAKHASPVGVSSELTQFAQDFENKILRPVREKRAATDEILGMYPVALGVSKNKAGCILPLLRGEFL